MKKLLTKFRRRLAYLVLSNKDKCLVSNALLNYDKGFIISTSQEDYSSLLHDMEGIYK